jgi:hypothetical protein
VTLVRDPLEVAVRVSSILDAIGIPYTIGGSIAASFAGEPRSTIDIDIVVALTHEQAATLVTALGSDFYVSEDAIHRAVDSAGTVNLIDQQTNIKVDLFVAGGTPLDAQQLARRRRVEVRPGQALYMHPPEDVLLQKLRWYMKGGGVSDRQWRDVIAIIRTQGRRLDRNYLSANSGVLNVSEVLQRALLEADGSQ